MSTDVHNPLPVLILTQQRLISDMIKLALNHGAYVTREARDASEAFEILETWEPKIAIIDMERAGDVLVRRLTQGNQSGHDRIPVLALTRRGDLKTKLTAFDHGADDIMTIPLSPEELLARVLVITRRRLGEKVEIKPVIKLGEIEIDILNRHVRAGTSEVHLSGLEQTLLYLLAANAGKVVTRDEIMDALWGVDFVPESNVVDRHVRSLRAKLQDGWRKPRFIATIPGEGYRFIPVFSDSAVASND